MARRLDFFFNKLEANLVAPPLTTSYISEDQDLNESDGEEGNDEDSKDTLVRYRRYGATL
jgi:hypothetical protein